jgi:membrane-bound lytic murein transglycosylase A
VPASLPVTSSPKSSGSPVQTDVYNVPVLKRPSDLVKLSAADARRLGVGYGRIHNGKAEAYYTRQEIEQGKLDGQGLEVAWLKSWADLFFMQVQGSGRVRLPDGSVLRLAYSLKSGLPYTSIGKVLIERGEMTREEMSMQALRKWLDDHPREARAVMWQNESYVFFRKLKDGVDPDLGPVGAQQVPLTPFRSLAVDRSVWALGRSCLGQHNCLPQWQISPVQRAHGRARYRLGNSRTPTGRHLLRLRRSGGS